PATLKKPGQTGECFRPAFWRLVGNEQSPAVCGFGVPCKPRSDRGTVLLLAAPDKGDGGGVAPIPFTRLFGTSGRRAVESIVPRRTFDDVILPPATRRALDTALAQVTQHDLIFNRWGLGERHPTGLALAFNFA